MTEVLFFIAAIGAIAGAVGVVSLQNPFYSVLALVFHLLSLAALFLLLQAQFIAAAQIVVYAGAVMVLYVFVVAYIGGGGEPFREGGGGGPRAVRDGRRRGTAGPAVRRGPSRRTLLRDPRDGAARGRHPRCGPRRRLRIAGSAGTAAARALPHPVRSRVVPAARRCSRGGRARAPPPRPGRRR